MERVPVPIGKYTVHIRSILSYTKPPIVLVHGLGVSGDYYIEYAKSLSEFFDVYIIDLPGYGKTPKPIKSLTIVQLSQVLLKYIQKEGIRNSTLVGQSMGCQIVAHTLVSAPHLFKNSIFIAPTVNIKERTVFMQGFRLWQDTFREPLGANLVVFTNYVRMGMRRFLITANYMVNDHIEDTVKNIRIPVLLATGSNDKIVPRAWVDYLAEETPHGKAVVVMDAPHLLQYKKPKKLVEITRNFTKV